MFRLLTLVAPPVCLVCRRPGTDFCSECRRSLPWLEEPLCPRCALPAPCGTRCPAAGAAFARAWAPVAYAGVARALLLALKRSRALAAVELMAAQMAAGLPADLLEEGVVLVPIPAHPSRVRRRGFDPAERLAAALARRTGVRTARCLARAARAERQAGATRAARLAPGRLGITARAGTRRIRAGRPRIPARALLVDDVHTTGATLRAAAAALRDAGSVWVGAITYARTIGGIDRVSTDKRGSQD